MALHAKVALGGIQISCKVASGHSERRHRYFTATMPDGYVAGRLYLNPVTLMEHCVRWLEA